MVRRKPAKKPQCPRTDWALRKLVFDKVAVLFSPASGGVLMQLQAFGLFLSNDFEHGKKLTEFMNRVAKPDTLWHSEPDCPLCAGQNMQRIPGEQYQHLLLFMCQGCHAIWLDNGELSNLRSLWRSRRWRSNFQIAIKDAVSQSQSKVAKETVSA